MKNRKLLAIFGLIFIFGMISNTYVRGATETISTLADKDCYVSSSSPDTNYGDDTVYFRVGYSYCWIKKSASWYESYFHFNFSDKPSDYIKAEISIFFFDVPRTIDVSVILIMESWDEDTITWNNYAKHEQVITNIILSEYSYTAEPEITKIDVTDYIPICLNAGLSGISICINATDALQNQLVLGFTRTTSTSFPSAKPHLIWTYDTSTGNGDGNGDTTTTINGYNLLIIVGLMLGIGTILIKKRKIKSIRN